MLEEVSVDDDDDKLGRFSVELELELDIGDEDEDSVELEDDSVGREAILFNRRDCNSGRGIPPPICSLKP